MSEPIILPENPLRPLTTEELVEALNPRCRNGCNSHRSSSGFAGAQSALTALSRWIDAGNAERDPEALLLHRLFKLTEEAGEVATATIGASGANPRKGVTNGYDLVLEELLDVAITALGAYEHIDGYRGRSLEALKSKIITVSERAGISLAAQD